MSEAVRLNKWQQFLLVFLRFSIGWHLLYQGFGKIRDPFWTSRGYLGSATGPLSSVFRDMAESATTVGLADQMTAWGMAVVGLLLMIGLFTRTASLGAVVLLALIYAAHPPLPSHGFAVPTIEGTELYVNKVWIEIFALVLCLSFDTGKISGIDAWLGPWLRRKRASASAPPSAPVTVGE